MNGAYSSSWDDRRGRGRALLRSVVSVARAASARRTSDRLKSTSSMPCRPTRRRSTSTSRTRSTSSATRSCPSRRRPEHAGEGHVLLALRRADRRGLAALHARPARGLRPPEDLDANGPLREPRGKGQVLGPDKWERGKIYADEQTFTMPADLRGPDTIDLRRHLQGRCASADHQRAERRRQPRDRRARSRPALRRREEKASAAPPTSPSCRSGKLAAGEKIVDRRQGRRQGMGRRSEHRPFCRRGNG